LLYKGLWRLKAATYLPPKHNTLPLLIER
jgi:hypothetical protein